MTRAHVPFPEPARGSPSHGQGGGGGYGFNAPAPSPAAAPMGYNNYGMDDQRPGTMPQHPSAGQNFGSPGGGHGGGGPKATLECVFSSGNSDCRGQNIPLISDQEVAIGRLHQVGFFEKLLPDHDSLACISRKHLSARLHRGGHMVEIENVSRNTVTIDSRTVGQGQKVELREGSVLRFTALEKTLLEFRLKSDAQAIAPATRFPGGF